MKPKLHNNLQLKILQYPWLILLFSIFYILCLRSGVILCYGWDLPFEKDIMDQTWGERPRYFPEISAEMLAQDKKDAMEKQRQFQLNESRIKKDTKLIEIKPTTAERTVFKTTMNVNTVAETTKDVPPVQVMSIVRSIDNPTAEITFKLQPSQDDTAREIEILEKNYEELRKKREQECAEEKAILEENYQELKEKRHQEYAEKNYEEFKKEQARKNAERQEEWLPSYDAIVARITQIEEEIRLSDINHSLNWMKGSINHLYVPKSFMTNPFENTNELLSLIETMNSKSSLDKSNILYAYMMHEIGLNIKMNCNADIDYFIRMGYTTTNIDGTVDNVITSPRIKNVWMGKGDTESEIRHHLLDIIEQKLCETIKSTTLEDKMETRVLLHLRTQIDIQDIRCSQNSSIKSYVYFPNCYKECFNQGIFLANNPSHSRYDSRVVCIYHG